MSYFVASIFLLFSSQSLVLSIEYKMLKVLTSDAANTTQFFSLDFVSLAQKYNYKAEAHSVTTEDGYILTVHRVLPSTKFLAESGKRPAAFLLHGLAASSDQFCVFEPDRSFGYLLSDMGYDVWLGNVRGNVYSRRHRTLSPEESKFWDYSLDEVALKDLPAMIDYVLKVTGQLSLTYVGHSMGGTTIFMLLSEKREYNDKINLAVLLAPAYYWKSDNVARVMFQSFVHLMREFYPDGITEFFPLSTLIPSYFKTNCLSSKSTLQLCFTALDLFTGFNGDQVSVEAIMELLQYFPAGGSLKLGYHYIQMYENSKFQHYDFKDSQIHLQRYGQALPPEYNVTNIITPMAIFLAESDPLTVPEEINELINKLSANVTVILKVIKNLNHIGFLCAKDIKTLFYTSLTEVLNKFHQSGGREL